MNKSYVAWQEFQGGYLGILPCGLTITVTRIAEGPYAGAFNARFAACEIRKIFWDADTAKREAITLTREALNNCLAALDSAF